MPYNFYLHPRWATLALSLVALIHLLPLSGLLGVAQLQQIYGLTAIDSTTELLLRHRAWQFGALGALLIYTIWQRAWRMPMLIFTLLSDLGFLLLALQAWPPGNALQRVVYFDLLSIALLIFLLLGSGRRMPLASP